MLPGGIDPFPPSRVTTFGADTPGGSGGAILHVTSLASAGPGTLREALSMSGPRTIVFDVAGVIDLGLSNLNVREPWVTIKGRSGPAPGITLIRGGLIIRTHDVRVLHLRVRPGDAGQAPGSGWQPDGIAVWGPDAHDVLIQNCSVTWAVDENVSVSSAHPPFDSPRRVTFRDCLIAEGLRSASHLEGNHSRGALVRGHEVAIEGCLFAYNTRRNPEFRERSSGIMVNNLIYDPETAAASLELSGIGMVGNVVIYGRDTIPGVRLLGGHGAAYGADNLAFDRAGNPVPLIDRDIRELPWSPEWRGPAYRPLRANRVESHVFLRAGAWPDRRDQIDRRILGQVYYRVGHLIDSQDDVGGYPH